MPFLAQNLALLVTAFTRAVVRGSLCLCAHPNSNQRLLRSSEPCAPIVHRKNAFSQRSICNLAYSLQTTMGTSSSRPNHSKSKPCIEPSLPESWGSAPRGRAWIARETRFPSAHAGHLSVLLDLGGHSLYQDTAFDRLKTFRGVQVFLGLEEAKPRRFTRQANLIVNLWPRMEKGIIVEEFSVDRCADVVLVEGMLNPLCSWESLEKAGQSWYDRLLPYVRESFLDFVDRQRATHTLHGDLNVDGEGMEEVEGGEPDAFSRESEAQAASRIEQACQQAILEMQRREKKGSKEKQQVKWLITSLEKSSRWCPIMHTTTSQKDLHTNRRFENGRTEGEADALDENDSDGVLEDGDGAFIPRQQGRLNGGVEGELNGTRTNGRRSDSNGETPRPLSDYDTTALLWDSKINSHTFARALVEDILSLRWPSKDGMGGEVNGGRFALYCPSDYASAFVDAVFVMTASSR